MVLYVIHLMFESWLSHTITFQNPQKSTANRTMILIHWQGSLVRELWLVVQYFLASSLSLPRGRPSVIVMGYISKVTLMRINQVLTSLHLQNMAQFTFAKYGLVIVYICKISWWLWQWIQYGWIFVGVCVYGFLWVISGCCGLLYYDTVYVFTGHWGTWLNGYLLLLLYNQLHCLLQ